MNNVKITTARMSPAIPDTIFIANSDAHIKLIISRLYFSVPKMSRIIARYLSLIVKCG